jgi:hypothetical protein
MMFSLSEDNVAALCAFTTSANMCISVNPVIEPISGIACHCKVEK